MDFDDTQPGLTGKPGDEYSSAAYRDYGTYLQNGGELITHKKSNRNFPVKLHRIVSDPSNSLVITWMVSGLSEVAKVVFAATARLCGLNPLVSLILNALR